MNIARELSTMSYARRLKVGCVIVRDGRILSTGWNGMPSGFPNDCEIEHDDGTLETRPEVMHAEENALLKVAESTESSRGGTMYTTHSPCIHCARMINSAGIDRLVFDEPYRKNAGSTFLEKYTIQVDQISDHQTQESYVR